MTFSRFSDFFRSLFSRAVNDEEYDGLPSISCIGLMSHDTSCGFP